VTTAQEKRIWLKTKKPWHPCNKIYFSEKKPIVKSSEKRSEETNNNNYAATCIHGIARVTFEPHCYWTIRPWLRGLI
jgi:hypothetical protein